MWRHINSKNKRKRKVGRHGGKKEGKERGRKKRWGEKERRKKERGREKGKEKFFIQPKNSYYGISKGGVKIRGGRKLMTVMKMIWTPLSRAH